MCFVDIEKAYDWVPQAVSASSALLSQTSWTAAGLHLVSSPVVDFMEEDCDACVTQVMYIFSTGAPDKVSPSRGLLVTGQRH